MATVAKRAEAQVKRPGVELHETDLCTTFNDAVAHTVRTMAPLVLQYGASVQPDVMAAQDRADLLADLEVLRALLASSDLRALDVHARVQLAAPRAAAKGFSELDQAVRDFDFAQGTVHCERLIYDLGSTSA